MRLPSTLAALAAVGPLLLAPAAFAGEPAAPALPDTPIGAAARDLVDALGGGDHGAIRRFVAGRLAADLDRQGLRTWTPATYEAMLRKLRDQGGGMDLADVRPRNEPGTLGLLLVSRRGERRLALELLESPREPGKLRAIEPHAMIPRPGPAAWPEGAPDDAAIAAAIDRRVGDLAGQDRFSGVVLVARGDRILVRKGYGMADRERSVANEPGTLIHTGSIGKMFTGVAIGQLVESGRLRFDDRLDAVLPEYPDRAAARRLTLDHLLTHTSGVADPFLAPAREPGRAYPTAWDNVRLIAGTPLEFEPGARHGYSNGNFAVLAAVIEKASGLAYGDYVRERIYKPAGMGAADPGDARSRPRAIGYTHPPDLDPLGLEPKRPAPESSGAVDLAEASGFGGIYLTADDVYRFLKALREGRLLGPAMAEEVTRGRVDVAPGAPVRYGYGFYEIGLWGTPTRGHSGGGDNSGIGAHAEALWDRHEYVVVLGNVDLEFVRPLVGDLVSFLARQPAARPRPGTR